MLEHLEHLEGKPEKCGTSSRQTTSRKLQYLKEVIVKKKKREKIKKQKNLVVKREKLNEELFLSPGIARPGAFGPNWEYPTDTY